MHLASYLHMLGAAEDALGSSYRTVATEHADEADVLYPCGHFSRSCTTHAELLAPVADRYDRLAGDEPDRFHPSAMPAARPGPVGLLRDLQDLYQLATLVESTWSLVQQAAAGARDRELLGVVDCCGPEITAQLDWLRTRMRAAAAQTLLVAK